MLALFRCLLCLYPVAHRSVYGKEMMSVFHEAQGEKRVKGLVSKIGFYFREFIGLLQGASEEHLRALMGSHGWTLFPVRRFHMRSEFRFPKSTTILMVIILAGVVMAIEKAKAIQASLPYVNPPIGPIQPAHFTFFPTIALMFLIFYAAGVIGWAILFALHRSGVHRLRDIESPAQPR
ncbi:MAG: hypothetical protein LAO24_23505 [Acidobacteriia bacterium]|nr:hypothetical protein [Terriglobia bacterium]